MNKSICKRIRSSTLNNCFAIYQKDYKLLFPDKKQFFNHCLSFLAIEAKNRGGIPDSSHTNKSIRSCYAALHRITAPQFIKTCLYSSWYKQVPNRCLLLLTLEAGDLLTRLKTISRYRKAHMSCRCCETFFKSSGKKHPLHYCS